nr:hypothetical protein [Armatimonas sp.]
MNIICWLQEYTLLEFTLHQANCPHCQARRAADQRVFALFEGVEAPSSTRTYDELLLLLPRTQTPRRALVWQLPALGVALACGVGSAFYFSRPVAVKQPTKVVALRPNLKNNSALPAISQRQHGVNVVMPKETKPATGYKHKLPRPALTPREMPISIVEQDDLLYLNPPLAAPELKQREEALRRSVAGGDDFITVALPAIAATDKGVGTALEAAQKEQAIVDARLVRTMTLAIKAQPFSQLCEQLTKETGITFTANPRVADDEVTLYCTARPLREIMRQLAKHFGFEWRRTGQEPQFSYELTQSLSRQLLEESLRQQDRDALLVKIEEEVRAFQKLLELSPEQRKTRREQLQEKMSKDRAAFNEYLRLGWLDQGAETVLPKFLQLSPDELGRIRSGQPYEWDLMPGGVISPALQRQVKEAFQNPFGGGELPQRDRGPITSLQGRLLLEKKEDAWTLRGYLQTNQGGIGLPLATAPTLANAAIDNAARNKALAKDPALQKLVSLSIAASCTLKHHSFPEFDEFTEGPKIIEADALAALHKATGQDIIGDQFLRLSIPVSVEKKSIFQALCTVGDSLRLHWGKSEGWLTFRTPDYYAARPQEIPQRLRERWSVTKRKNGSLTIHELAEMGSLPVATLDSSRVAQSLIARYGLDEWPLIRAEQARPHWSLLSQLTAEQREAAVSEAGLAYSALRPKLRGAFEALLQLPSERPNPPTFRDSRLWVLRGAKAEKVLPNPGVVFTYRYDDPAIYNTWSPFNGISGMHEAMYQQRFRK